MDQKIDYEKIRALGDLWDRKKADWELYVSHCLTEPTCPTAIVRVEGSADNRYRADRDTIEAAINAAVDMAYRELILGEAIEPECPFS